jgi:hypothetical protein
MTTEETIVQIDLEDGKIEDVRTPVGVVVVIRDFDNWINEESTKQDDYGNYYSEHIIWRVAS